MYQITILAMFLGGYHHGLMQPVQNFENSLFRTKYDINHMGPNRIRQLYLSYPLFEVHLAILLLVMSQSFEGKLHTCIPKALKTNFKLFKTLYSFYIGLV